MTWCWHRWSKWSKVFVSDGVPWQYKNCVKCEKTKMRQAW